MFVPFRQNSRDADLRRSRTACGAFRDKHRDGTHSVSGSQSGRPRNASAVAASSAAETMPTAVQVGVPIGRPCGSFSRCSGSSFVRKCVPPGGDRRGTLGSSGDRYVSPCGWNASVPVARASEDGAGCDCGVPALCWRAFSLATPVADTRTSSAARATPHAPVLLLLVPFPSTVALISRLRRTPSPITPSCSNGHRTPSYSAATPAAAWFGRAYLPPTFASSPSFFPLRQVLSQSGWANSDAPSTLAKTMSSANSPFSGSSWARCRMRLAIS